MTLETLYCKKCGGGPLDKVSDTEYKCPFCGCTFHDNSAALKATAAENKNREKVNGLRRELYEKVQEKYIDNASILDLCKQVKEIDPEDCLANFYSVAALDQDDGVNEIKLCKHLDSLDLEQFEDFIDTIVDYMLKSLTPRNMMSVGNLIERAYHQKDPVKYGTIRTHFDEECAKVSNLVYDPSVERDIFLCYASPDMDVVMDTLRYFEDKGLTCFVAVRNMQHGNGAVANYWDVIHTAIDNCKTVVFISSNNSRTNARDSKKELDYISANDANRKTPMTKIELVVEPYTNEPSRKVIETVFKGYFEDGYSFESAEDIYNNIFNPDKKAQKGVRENAMAPQISEEDEVLCDPFVIRDCFIACDEEDYDEGLKLVEYLESEDNGITCFIEKRNTKTWDPEDETSYLRKIKFAINNCKCFVLVSTKASRSYRSICKKEMDYILETENERSLPLKKIHYVIEGFSGEKNEAFVRSFFGALEDVYKPEGVLTRYLTVDKKASKKKASDIDFTSILPKDVYLVYEEADEARAEELMNFLEQNGLTCFFKKRDFEGEEDELLKNLKTIIDGCQSVAFVSSNNARTGTSVCKKELDTIATYDKNRNEPIKKVEYLIESYSGKPIDKIFQRYFFENNTYNSSPNSEEVFDKLIGFSGAEIEEEPKKEDIKNYDALEKEIKICKFCGAENPTSARFCCDCGEDSFVATRDEYLRLKRASKKELERMQENEYRETSEGLKNNTIIYASTQAERDEVDARNKANANNPKNKAKNDNADDTPIDRAFADFYADASNKNKAKKNNADDDIDLANFYADSSSKNKAKKNSAADDDIDLNNFYADANKNKSKAKSKDDDIDLNNFYADANKNKAKKSSAADDDIDLNNFYADAHKNKSKSKASNDDDIDLNNFYADANKNKAKGSESRPVVRENAYADARTNTSTPSHVSYQQIELQVGQRIVVSDNISHIQLSTKAQGKLDNFESDSFIFLLDENNKVRNEGDLIYFNNDSTISNSIVLKNMGNLTEKIDVNLNKISNSADKISFIYSVVSNNGAKLNFSMATELQFSLLVGENKYLFKINNIDRTSKSIYLFELYKHKNNWKIRVIGLPTNKDINSICNEYGLDIA